MTRHRSFSLRVRLLAPLALGLAGLVMSAILGEIYVRWTKAYATPDTLRQQSLEYESTLFSRYAFPQTEQDKLYAGKTDMKINRQGYRGRECSIPKPPGVVRVIILGGSATFDVEASDQEDWPHRVQTKLRARGMETVEVLNAGTPGHASWDSLGRFYAELWMYEPDYVLTYHSWNDIKYFSTLDAERSLLRTFRPASSGGDGHSSLVGNPFMYYTGPLDRAASISQLYVRLRSRYWSWRYGIIGFEGAIGLDPIGSEPQHAQKYEDWGPRQFELDLRLIVAASRAVGAVPVLLTQARLVRALNSDEEKAKIGYEHVRLSHEALVRAFSDCDDRIRSVAQSEDVALLELGAVAFGRSDWFVDHVHTTSLGSESLAEATTEFLLPLLRNELAAR